MVPRLLRKEKHLARVAKRQRKKMKYMHDATTGHFVISHIYYLLQLVAFGNFEHGKMLDLDLGLLR